VIRDEIRPGTPQPSEFLVFNTRKPVFADIRVRQALTLLFDFEWVNRNYFFGLYGRAPDSSPAPTCPPTPALRMRAKRRCSRLYRRYPPDIMDGSYRLPVTDASGRDRATLRARSRCLRRPDTSSTAPCCARRHARAAEL
jgi:peptide/nickel transport system substrate-binding protein